MTFKKFLSVFVLTFFVKFGFGQVYQSMPQYGYGPIKRMDIDSSLTIPTTCGVPSIRTNLTRKSAIAFDTCNNRFYYYNSKTLVWDTIKGGSGTTSDTASVVKATVKNAEATTITKGTVVYLYGATGNIASVKKAYNTSDTFSSKTFAIVKDDISANGTGTVITQGVVDKLNLGAFSEGDIVWLDSLPGQFTKNKPSAPYHSVFIGVVERANNGNGQLYVKIQNGYELGELHNVSVNGQVDNDILYYQLSTKLWKAKSPYQLVDTSKLSARIDLRVKYSDTASMLSTYQRSISAVKYSDTTSLIATKTNLLSEVNISDTASMLSKYLRKTDTSTLSSRIDLRMRFTDSATMLTPYLRKTDTASLSTRIDAKFTLPSLTSGSVLYSNGTTISQNNANFFWDNTNVRFGIGTNAPTTTFQINRTNTDYTNTSGAGSHIYMTNPSATGQNVVASFINGAMVAKWRTDNVGNISWVAGANGAHDFYTKGDYAVGNIQMRIFNGGNVQISTSAVGGANTDAGYKLDVQGTGRYTNVLLSTGNQVAVTSKTTTYTAANTDEIISCSGASGAFTVTLPTAVGRTGQRFTIKKNDSGANAITVGTTSSQTIDGATTYSLATQWKYVTVVSNGSNWLIIANN